MAKVSSPTETSIVRAVLKRLNAMDRCKAIKLHGSEFLEKGTPDIHATYRGRSCWLEVKRPGEKPTVIQEKRLEQWAEAGAAVGAVTSADEAVQVVLLSDAPLEHDPLTMVARVE